MKSRLSQKTNFAFLQMALIAVSIFIAGYFLSFEIYKKANVYLGVLYHHLMAACGCTDVVQFLNMHPAIFAEIAILAITLMSFSIFAAYKFFKLYSTTAKFTRHCLSHCAKKHSWKLRSVLSELKIEKEKITEIQSAETAVFCYGLLKPKICISTSLVSLLDKDELKSVLLHEKYHMKNYEPLRIFVVMYLANIFFFLPGIRKLSRKYYTFSELSADEAASRIPSGKSKLAKAIFKISENDFGEDMSSPAIAERVNRLADDAYIPNIKNLGRSFALTIVVFSFALVYSSTILSKSSQAYEMHQNGICSEYGENEYDFIGEIVNGEKSCTMHSDKHFDTGECKAE